MKEKIIIKKIQKSDEIHVKYAKVIKNVRYISICSLLVFVSYNENPDYAQQILIIISTVIGATNLMSMVKSLCKIYQLKEEKKFQHGNK